MAPLDDDRDNGQTGRGPADTAAATRRCGRCDAENEADAAFCDACHALLAAYDPPSGAQPDEPGSPLDGSPASEERAPAVDPPRGDDGFDALVLAEPATEGTAEPVQVAPPVDGARAPAWFDLPRRDGEESPAAAIESQPLVPVVGGPAGASDAGEWNTTSTPGESATVPAPADGRTAAVALPDDPTTATPAVSGDLRGEATVPGLVEPIERRPVVPAGPRKAGRLARTSPATLLLVGAVLGLGSCGLIVAAWLGGAVGAVGTAGLALGAIAVYVVAVGLIQAVLRLGR